MALSFSQGLLSSLTNPNFNLTGVGQKIGGLGGQRRQAEQEALKQQQATGGLLSAYQLGAAPGGADPAAALAAMAQGTNASPEQAQAMLANMQAGQQQAEVIRQRMAAKGEAESAAAFSSKLSDMLLAKGQEGFANLVSKVPDFNKLPAEVQNRILSAAGITDPEDQAKAVSPEGKQATDLGYVPGTAQHAAKTAELINIAQAGVPSEAFNAINSAVKDTVDLAKSQKINDAITAISSSGKAGAGALQENTIIDLFGSSLRAEAAVKRFASSASLPRRIVDSISKFATGATTELTLEDREALIYAAAKMQEASLDTAVNNSSDALRVPGELTPSIRAVYDYPSFSQEWLQRYENKYRSTQQKNSAPPIAVSRPDNVPQNWQKATDANGSVAWVNPDNLSEFVEVSDNGI